MIFARRQAETLRAEAVDVTAFYLRSRTSLPLLIREFRRFRREVANVRPHVIHAHFGTVTGLFTVLASGAIPVVITYRGSDLNKVPGPLLVQVRSAIARSFSQLAAIRAARSICVSRQLRDRLWWRKDRAIVLPSGVDTSLFYPRSVAAARRELGIPAEDRVVLFNAGNDPRIKRLDLATEAASIARRSLPNLRMIVLDGTVPPGRVPLFMSAADCLLLTSDSEGSPTVVQEALASSLPVVSVDVGDVRERLEGVSPGAVAPRDPAVLAAELVAVLRNPVRSNGRVKTKELASGHIAKQLRRTYEKLSMRAKALAIDF